MNGYEFNLYTEKHEMSEIINTIIAINKNSTEIYDIMQ